mgnify:CR=1 FL=1
MVIKNGNTRKPEDAAARISASIHGLSKRKGTKRFVSGYEKT